MMLENLPDEIIFEITKYLNFYARLNLVETCHRLNLLLYNTKLFEELTIPRKHTDAIIQLFQDKKQLDGSMVRKLHLELSQSKKYDLAQIPVIFPRVKELYTGQCRQLTLKMESQDIERAKSIKDQLERYDIKNCHEAIALLIEAYPFNHLKYLSLRPSVYKNKREYNINVFDCLKHAPLLETLKLDGFNINLTFLEHLHRNSPKLKTLELYSTKLGIVNEQLPSFIAPSSCLETFTMTRNYEFFDRHCFLLEYIIMKYPKLTSLHLEFWLILPGIDRFIEEIFHTDRVYRQRLPELMSQLIPRVKTLKIEPKLFENFTDSMSPISSHLKEISFYTSIDSHAMFRSLKDLYYIQSLTYLSSLSVQSRGTEYLYHENVILPNIKYLSLFDRNHFDEDPNLMLDQLLSTYIGLETLVIESHRTRVSISPDVTDNNKKGHSCSYPSLKSLKFVVPDVASEMNEFIRRSLPGLTEIYWHTIEKPREYMFDWPQHTLSMFNLVFFNERFRLHPDRQCHIHYQITKMSTGTIKRVNYTVSGMHDKKVTENHFALPLFMKVEIICKDLWQLRDQEVVLF